jgi:hypothetical protein
MANCRGLCLAEVLIALTAGAVVMAATFQSLAAFERRLAKQQEQAAKRQELRIGLKVLEDDLRAATAQTPSGSPVWTAAPEELAWDANLSNLVTTLTAPVSAEQPVLPVASGTGWPKGKRIAVCDAHRCVVGQLARDGSATSLSLVSSLGFDFPAGSEVRVLNRVRYYVKHERGKPARVMREVDGGTNPLIGAVSTFQFRYLTREGMPTRDPAQVVGIRIEAAAEDDPVPLIRTIGLRGW